MKNSFQFILPILFLLCNFPLIAGSSILITGGAGYIGSHIAYRMKQEGYRIIVLDKKYNQDLTDWAECIRGDVADTNLLHQIFKQYDIEAVVHCAALLSVGESVHHPNKYYRNNVINTLLLLETMLAHGVHKLIFSSSAAVYGVPKKVPIPENHPRNPINPYGKTKLMIEMICEDFASAYGLSFVILRYFNAAGAMPAWGLGEIHDPETHLIPLLLRAAIEKRPFYIFGTDYPTKDGTCVRDFIHVLDIAEAHVAALRYLQNGGQSDYFNLGTGHGFSVEEVIKETQRVCKTPINIVYSDRRPGDPPVLVAEANKVQTILGWKPVHSQLNNIIQSAYEFMCSFIYK